MEGSEEEEVDGSEAGGDSEDGDELKEPNGVEEMAEEEEITIQQNSLWPSMLMTSE